MADVLAVGVAEEVAVGETEGLALALAVGVGEKVGVGLGLVQSSKFVVHEAPNDGQQYWTEPQYAFVPTLAIVEQLISRGDPPMAIE